MSTLKEKAQDILTEKNEKIKPENIKKDVQIFDVTGTLEGGSAKPVLPNTIGMYISSDLFDIKTWNSFDPDSPIPAEYWAPIFNSLVQGLDYSQVKSFSGMFYQFITDDYSELNFNINTSSGRYFNTMFEEAGIITAPSYNLINATYLYGMFMNCADLENVPVYQIHTSLEDIEEEAEYNGRTLDEYLQNAFVADMFAGCPNLTEESLNNILAMIADEDFPLNKIEVSGAHYKTLTLLGLSLDQCNLCTQLDNWEAAALMGWEPYAPLN